MRVDFSKQQLRSEEEVQLLRLMRAVHAMAASLVVSVAMAFAYAYSLAPQERQWAGSSTGRVYSAAPAPGHLQSDAVSASAIDPALNVIDGVTHHG
ncbi:MAG: hypothetical protein H0V63_11435 [Burkholderiaceae bacterium]|nr:hypothetical protein [Burkholderiaceae bacterium]